MIEKIILNIKTDWKQVLINEFNKPYFSNLKNFVENEYKTKTIYPKIENIFRCFSFFNPQETKVVILGQDPYHTPNVADGLAFSTQSSVEPKSLANMFIELENDLHIKRTNFNLTDIAKQGVLLLNACLTVEKNKAFSHANKGWEIFTDNIIKYVNDNFTSVVYLLMGKSAQSKSILISKKENIIQTSHPSPFSCHISFFGSKVFSKINMLLNKNNYKEIIW